MITAQQAREYVENKPLIELDKLLSEIERRAKAGYDFTWIENNSISTEDQKTLSDLGYIIKKDETLSFKISW